MATWTMCCFAVTACQGQQAAPDKNPNFSRLERANRLMTAPTRTFYFKNVAAQNEANEIITAIRNVVALDVTIYLVWSQRAFLVRALPEDLAAVAQVLEGLDRPRESYRITYTLVELDGTRRLSTQHYGLTVMDGQRTTLKQGNKMPLTTGKYNVTSSEVETQLVYTDVGLSFAATVNTVEGGATLQSRVEQSSVPEEKLAQGDHDPVIRQTALETVSRVTLGKPSALGSLDIPGTTRHLEIEATLEKAP